MADQMSPVSKALSHEQPSRGGTFDLFLSELEDDLRKLRENGQPIRSLWQFSDVVQHSYRHACECSRQGSTQVTKVIRCEHGGYLAAMPDGLIKVDSQNPNGDWEKFLLVELEDERVAIRSDHGRYLAVQGDGSVRADAQSADSEAARFELAEHSNGGLLLATSEGKYLIAMPDGSLRADSPNPDGTWEQFEISDLQKDVILNRKELFEFFDRLSEEAECFTSLTYVVNQWNMGGVVRLKHHSCILAGGGRYLKFDFGRWGVGWSLSEDFPDLPRGTCLKETFDIQASPDTIRQYLLDAKDFSWISNNCSSFSAGLMRELQITQPSTLPDLWPTWSRCLATPPVKVPGTGRGRRRVGPPPLGAGAQEAVGSLTGFALDAGTGPAMDSPKALSPCSRTADTHDAVQPDRVVEDSVPRADAQEPQEFPELAGDTLDASTHSRSSAERGLSRSSSTISI